jgi:Cu-processing system permease protein
MSGVLIVAGFALRESLRRRVFVVVALLTVGFLALYGLGVWQIAKDAEQIGGVDSGTGVESRTLAGATLLGLSMFATLFLGAILAVFLTLNAVRGDAERGLLQPMVVRPLPRSYVLLGRFLAAASVCAVYVIVVFVASAVLTDIFVDWWPDRVVVPALVLAAAVAVIAALALAGSVVLSTTANGIAVFMLFGAGLVAGLLGQIAEALSSDTLERVSTIASWFLPFEALYQTALQAITAETFGFTRFAIDLGPFGGAQTFGPWLAPFTVAYLAALGAAALWAFRRRDL